MHVDCERSRYAVYHCSCTYRFRGIVRADRPIAYWDVWTARLIFIVVFEV